LLINELDQILVMFDVHTTCRGSFVFKSLFFLLAGGFHNFELTQNRDDLQCFELISKSYLDILRFRFLRYDPGEYFKPHMDGSYRRDNGDESKITVFIYLNEVSRAIMMIMMMMISYFNCLIPDFFPLKLCRDMKEAVQHF
jgi:hypothetical protein